MSAIIHSSTVEGVTAERDSSDPRSSPTSQPPCRNLDYARFAGKDLCEAHSRVVYRTLGAALLGLAGISAPLIGAAFWANANYGSLGAAAAAYRGETLYVDSVEKYAQPAQMPTSSVASFKITNLTSSPVTIIGARRSCSCLSIRRLPLTMQPSETAEIELEIRPSRNDQGQEVTQSATLYIDANCRRPTLTLHASFY